MSATEAEIKSWLKTGPFAGRNWDQACQAFCYQVTARFGTAHLTYLSANRAYRASKIVSKDASKAPAGSFHYWDIGTYGHVAIGLGGTKVLMASKYVDTKWATNVGTTTTTAYAKKTGARYLGWSNTNGQNDVTIVKSHVAAVPKLKADQRKAAMNTNARQTPSSTSRIVGSIDKGKVGNFKGWKKGEKIDGNAVWFQGDSGHWFWSGGFESRATTGLKEIK